jgi:hypothetical protein
VSGAAKQGTGDGLCGIYCLINFMRGWFESDPTENDREAFRYVMRAAEQLDILTADKVHSGYEETDLRDIFDSVVATRSKDFRSIPVRLTNKRESIVKCRTKQKKFGDGGQAILSVDDREHWVLATQLLGNNMIQILDPCPRARRIQMKIEDLAKPFTALALLPLGSELLGAKP